MCFINTDYLLILISEYIYYMQIENFPSLGGNHIKRYIYVYVYTHISTNTYIATNIYIIFLETSPLKYLNHGHWGILYTILCTVEVSCKHYHFDYKIFQFWAKSIL